ncbi:MAG: APC family permease [bacterium]|nr:APC family permease [bacterium]
MATDSSDTTANPAHLTHQSELRRNVTVWGSFMWGYADVGANIFVALGLVMAAAQGATNIAFAFAGIVYILVGLAYTELASAFPVAGGGQYFALRGLGDFWGFLAGSALLLAYTIDIALFSTAAAGYINFFIPAFRDFRISIGPLVNLNPIWCLQALILISILIWLNIKGIRESSVLNEIFGAFVITVEGLIIVIGFIFTWKPEMLVWHWTTQFPTREEFMYGCSLAIISFIGLESISQAAQETRRPATIIPRTSLSLIFNVFIFATAFSTLSLGILDWREIALREGDAVARLTNDIAYIGLIAGPLTAILGAALLFISTNTGIVGASRLAYSMSQFNGISEWFNKVHSKYKTPVRTIIVFSGLGIIELFLAFLTPKTMNTLGNMYAFGASLGYSLVFISLIKLRFSDPYTPRPYKMPLNIRFKYQQQVIEFPILGIVGLMGISTIFFIVVSAHEIGRIAGPAWVGLCFIYYAWYRKKKRLPVFGSVKRDWETQQKLVLESAEEFDLLEQYKNALAERDRKRAPITESEPNGARKNSFSNRT